MSFANTATSLAVLSTLVALTSAGKAHAEETVPTAPGAAVARPAQPDSGRKAAGITLAIAGPLVMVTGAVVILFGVGKVNTVSAVCGPGTPCPDPASGGTALIAGGAITAGLGLAGTIVGAVLLASLPRTPDDSPQLALVARRPIWNAERPLVPTAPFTIPILFGTF